MTATATTAPATVGDAATFSIGSDSYPATVIAVTPRSITIQEDFATATADSDYFGTQKYDYTPNPDATPMVFTLRKGGHWALKGNSSRGGFQLSIGSRRKYMDPSF